jgi:hypothetical protein
MLVVEGTGSRVHVLSHVVTRIALKFVAVWRRRNNVWRTVYVLWYLLLSPLLVLSEVVHLQCRGKFETLGAKVVQWAARRQDLTVRPVEGGEVADIKVANVANITNVDEAGKVNVLHVLQVHVIWLLP